MFDRLSSLIGKENLEKITFKKVLVIGVGGVGGYVVEGLVRSGIEDITLIDGDKVDASNINRQIIALNSTIGEYKVDVFKRRILDINPNVKVQTKNEFVTTDMLKSLRLEDYDYIVDAIDDVKVKVELAKYSLEHDLFLISSTGTARKMDPSKLLITTLDKTSYDPLAKRMRQELKSYNTKKLVVLASTETPYNIQDESLGSSAFVPSSGGLLIASYIINDIIGH